MFTSFLDVVSDCLLPALYRHRIHILSTFVYTLCNLGAILLPSFFPQNSEPENLMLIEMLDANEDGEVDSFEWTTMLSQVTLLYTQGYPGRVCPSFV